MIERLFKYLPYILPVKTPHSTDQCILMTSRRFMGLYGDVIQEVLRDMGLLKKSEQQLKESDVDHVISVITEYIELSEHDAYVWNNYSKLIVFPSEKFKPNGLKIYLKQKQQGKIAPNKFMVKKETPAGFNEKCVIGMMFQSFLILFDKLLTQTNTNGINITKTLFNARLFNLVDATNQANVFVYAFFTARSRRKGSKITINTKHNRKNDVLKIMKELGITTKDKTPRKLPLTLERIKQEYKNKFKKNKFPVSDKTLENWVLEAPNYTKILAS